MQDLYALKITLSNYCHYKCKYCYVDTDSTKVVSEKLLYQSLDYYLSQKWEEKIVFFLGGEALLQFDLLKKWILRAKRKSRWKKLHIFITTSWLSLTQEKVDFFSKNGVKLGLSMDGDQHIHGVNRVSKTWKNTYDATLWALQIFNSRYDDTNLGYAMTVDENTVERTFESFLFLSNLDEKHRNVTVAWVYKENWKPENIEILDNEIKKICNFIYQQISQWNFYFYNVLSFFILQLLKGNVLDDWNVEMHVFPDGQISLFLFAQSVLGNMSNDPTQKRFDFVNKFAKAIVHKSQNDEQYKQYVDALFLKPIL